MNKSSPPDGTLFASNDDRIAGFPPLTKLLILGLMGGAPQNAELQERKRARNSALREAVVTEAGFEPATPSSGGWVTMSIQVPDYITVSKKLRPSGLPRSGEVSEE